VIFNLSLSVDAREKGDVVPYQSLPWMGPDLRGQFDEQDQLRMKDFSDSIEAVLVPGFFHEWFKGYMDPIRDWLSSHSIQHSTAVIGSDQSSASNADQIALHVQSAQKPVLILAHSRGGVDVLESLIRHPHLQSKVYGVIFIQSPFFGTWIADFFSGRSARSQALDAWSRFLLHSRLLPQSLRKKLFGIWQSTKALTALHRQAWMKENALEVEKIFESSTGLTVITKDQSFLKLRLFEFFRMIMQRKGIMSDGVVPERSMQIPGVARVALEHLNHAFFVFRNRKAQSQQFDICSRALLTIRQLKRESQN
jgi:hypothetical protein